MSNREPSIAKELTDIAVPQMLESPETYLIVRLAIQRSNPDDAKNDCTWQVRKIVYTVACEVARHIAFFDPHGYFVTPLHDALVKEGVRYILNAFRD